MKIQEIKSRKIINSYGVWTLETKIILDDGSVGMASTPGGISRGENEATIIETNKALENIDKIKDQLIEQNFQSQKDFDNCLLEIDGTNDKSNLGGNTILSLSMAFCKACAISKNLETYQYIHTLLNQDIPLTEVEFQLPEMMMLMLEGGTHGSSSATIQEFMAIVANFDRGIEIYTNIRKELEKLGKSTNVGAEGAFSPEGYDNEQSLTLLAGYLHGETIALDVAYSSFPEGIEHPNYDEMLKSYPISSIEDPYGENDWTNWELFGQKYSDKITIVTDDLTTTNPKILREAISKDVGNAILVKPNQIGTVSETLEVAEIAKTNGWQTVVSHRSTDTNDDFISDLAVGIQSDFVKFGAPARGERVAKYNRLLEIFPI